MRAVLAVTLFAFLAAATLGCGGGDPVAPKKTAVDIKDVPPEFMKTAKEKLPEVVTFMDAFRKENGVFEIRGKEKTGKIREVGIRPDGTVTDIE